jgi:hypothetical protein
MMRSLFAFVAGGAMLLSSAVSAAEIARHSSPVGEQEEIAGHPWLPWAVALIALIVIVVVVTDSDDEAQSP